MKEYAFPELGYFSAGEIHQLAAVMDGRTFMKFKVGYCNQAGNCTLIVMTDYVALDEEIKSFFLSAAISTLLEILRERGDKP